MMTLSMTVARILNETTIFACNAGIAGKAVTYKNTADFLKRMKLTSAAAILSSTVGAGAAFER